MLLANYIFDQYCYIIGSASLLVFTFIFLKKIQNDFFYLKLEEKKYIVLITGCDSGMGEMTSKALSKRVEFKKKKYCNFQK